MHLADLDPQQTSSVWLQAAEVLSIPCSTIPADSDPMMEILPPQLEGGPVAVVDGPAGLSDAPRAMIILGVLVLTPVHPAGAVLRSAT